ncbi:MAG TPA: hypothetical protein PKE04_16000 [Clostridia bacterium]|nr:hypothetical protein [Clostridia bacterium]
MSKRWMAGQLAVLVVCALCLALAWLVGKMPEAESGQNGVTLEEPGLLPSDASMRGKDRPEIWNLPVPGAFA